MYKKKNSYTKKNPFFDKSNTKNKITKIVGKVKKIQFDVNQKSIENRKKLSKGDKINLRIPTDVFNGKLQELKISLEYGKNDSDECIISPEKMIYGEENDLVFKFEKKEAGELKFKAIPLNFGQYLQLETPIEASNFGFKEIIDLIFTEIRDIPPKDSNGFSDCYFIVSLENTNDPFEEYKHSSPIFISSVVYKSLDPSYQHHCSFFYQEKKESFLYLDLYDRDELSKDDFIGKLINFYYFIILFLLFYYILNFLF